MYYTYILECWSDTQHVLYVGQTSDLGRRLAQHQAGESTYTSRFDHISLRFAILVPTRIMAIRCERKLKRSSTIKKELVSTNDDVPSKFWKWYYAQFEQRCVWDLIDHIHLTKRGIELVFRNGIEVIKWKGWKQLTLPDVINADAN